MLHRGLLLNLLLRTCCPGPAVNVSQPTPHPLPQGQRLFQAPSHCPSQSVCQLPTSLSPAPQPVLTVLHVLAASLCPPLAQPSALTVCSHPPYTLRYVSPTISLPLRPLFFLPSFIPKQRTYCCTHAVSGSRLNPCPVTSMTPCSLPPLWPPQLLRMQHSRLHTHPSRVPMRSKGFLRLPECCA